MNVIFENEKNRPDSENAFDEDDLIHFQASYKILLEILSGDESRISEACYDWQEALGAHLLWVNPFCKRDDLP
jgi:nuclear pore complex protein Nup85